MSDLHLRLWTGLLSETHQHLRRLSADVVVITGDFDDCFSNPRAAAELTAKLLEGVTPQLGCFGVLGNHDDLAFAGLVSKHVRVLSNESVVLERNGANLMLAGIDGRTETSWDLAGALSGYKEQQFTVLLAHYPSTIYHLPHDRVDLMLSGHTHAGQWRLPGIGSPLIRIAGLPTRYCWGLHRLDGTQFHVSAGLGYSRRAPFRILCQPEISVLTLRRA